MSRPHISVVIPTYRRPEVVGRAVASLVAQRYDNWDAVISREFATDVPAIAATDSRIKVITNPGPHGQVGNLRHAMAHATGEWIKPLYDDDTLHPEALRSLAGAAELAPDAAIVRGLARDVIDGRPARVDRRGARARVERLGSNQAQRALMLHDEDVGIPSQVLVNRRLVEGGILPEDVPGLVSGVDLWWYVRLLGQGDLLLLNEVVVDRHQGEGPTVTGSVTPTALDREFAELARRAWPLVASLDDVDGLARALATTRAVRAIHRLSRGRVLAATRLAVQAGADPAAWSNALRWALRRTFPGRFQRFSRQMLAP